MQHRVHAPFNEKRGDALRQRARARRRFQQAVVRPPSHRVILWDEDDAARCSFISVFGDIAAARLLKESDGCSLHERYLIAHLLTLLLPGSRELIQKTADDEAADEDRRRTAQLALTLITKSGGGGVLKETTDRHR